MLHDPLHDNPIYAYALRENVAGSNTPVHPRVRCARAHAHTRTHAHEKKTGATCYKHLATRLGITDFRPAQLEAIDAVNAGRDVLLIQPTGSGKTPAFLAAALAIGGPTVVVAPLRSLIADLVRRIRACGLDAQPWTADVGNDVKDRILSMLVDGWTGFLVTTPESLRNTNLQMHLNGRVGLAVLDEAHCALSEGAFRPAYRKLGQLIDAINPKIRFACTATNALRHREMLIAAVGLRAAAVIQASPARPNITIRIIERDTLALAHVLNAHLGECGLIFSATIRTAESLRERLVSCGRRVGLYHGQLSAKMKQAAQTAFMSGETPLFVCTDSFIMGVDHSRIRFTVHWDYPKSIEDWLQGFGRAGRDGAPATAYGCFRGSDDGRKSRLFLLGMTYPQVEALRSIWQYLTARPFTDKSAESIGCDVLGIQGKYIGPAAISQLERAGLCTVERNPQDGRRRIYRGAGNFDASEWQKLYRAESAEAMGRFNALVELVAIPEAEIPAAIDRYFAEG